MRYLQLNKVSDTQHNGFGGHEDTFQSAPAEDFVLFAVEIPFCQDSWEGECCLLHHSRSIHRVPAGPGLRLCRQSHRMADGCFDLLPVPFRSQRDRR